MATVHIVLAGAGARSSIGDSQPVVDALPNGVDTITSSGSSQQADLVTAQSTAGYGLYWEITVSGGDVWVKFGANPTAAEGEGYLLLDGQVRDFGASPGQKCAVIDA